MLPIDQDLTSLSMGFGEVALRETTSMSEYSISMPLPIETLAYPTAIQTREKESVRAEDPRNGTLFTPLVFSATGGIAKQATTFHKRLASFLAQHSAGYAVTSLFH